MIIIKDDVSKFRYENEPSKHVKRYFQENKSYNLGEVITAHLLCRINKDFYRHIKKIN